MFFASDNSGPVAPAIMAAMADANSGHSMAYGNDPWMEKAQAEIREVFEAPEAAVYLVSTGTAANALALSTLTSPFQAIYCSPLAHIVEDECNAPEFFSGGARMSPVGNSVKINPDALRDVIAGQAQGDVHCTQRGPLSITQVTERGTVYTLDEIRALTRIAQDFDLPTHLDGARFANAQVALGCTPADMTWRAGIDAVSFGGTKNGCMGVEAVIFFDPAHAWQFELRRKRAGHLVSKHRYLAAQMLGYLQKDLWLTLAKTSNAKGAALAEGLATIPDASLAHPVDANMLFLTLPRALHAKLQAAGARYAVMGDLTTGADDDALMCRLVCDWSISDDAIDQFLTLARAG